MQNNNPETGKQFTLAIESGNKRVFASVLEWPGWTRSGRNETEAIERLLSYGPRYQHAIKNANINFVAPDNLNKFKIVERLTGNVTTDFGAPDIAATAESDAVDAIELARLQAILNSCWKVFSEAVVSARGKQLKRGPQGGGRSVVEIVDHLIGSHSSYLRMIHWREKQEKMQDVFYLLRSITNAEKEALVFATSGQMPKSGPRGGKLWKPRYFVRRAAWHILDHAWEIEDRIIP